MIRHAADVDERDMFAVSLNIFQCTVLSSVLHTAVKCHCFCFFCYSMHI